MLYIREGPLCNVLELELQPMEWREYKSEDLHSARVVYVLLVTNLRKISNTCTKLIC